MWWSLIWVNHSTDVCKMNQKKESVSSFVLHNVWQINFIKFHTSEKYKWAHHKVINIVGWNALHANKEDWFRLLCVVAPAEGNNCKFICLSLPRQRRRKANSYFTILSFWYALKISRDLWLSSMTSHSLFVERLRPRFIFCLIIKLSRFMFYHEN